MPAPIYARYEQSGDGRQFAGHSLAKSMTDIYTHVNLDSKRVAVMAMQDVFMQ